MADLAAVAAADVSAAKVIEQMTGPAGAVITAGMLVGLDANGHFIAADDDAVNPVECVGIAIGSATFAGQTITVVSKGWVDVGDVMDGMDYGDDVFVGSGAGVMADAQTVAMDAIGKVWPAFGHTGDADKLLRIDV